MTPDAFARLHAHCFQLPPPWGAVDFAQMLADPACVVLHRAEGDTLRAFGIFRSVADEGEVLTLATAPDAQRRGLARAILRDGLAVLAQRGVQVCFLEVAAGNDAALSLYHSAGFRQVGSRQGYYRSPTRTLDALVLKAEIAS